jgi:hypothetical protein
MIRSGRSETAASGSFGEIARAGSGSYENAGTVGRMIRSRPHFHGPRCPERGHDGSFGETSRVHLKYVVFELPNLPQAVHRPPSEAMVN